MVFFRPHRDASHPGHPGGGGMGPGRGSRSPEPPPADLPPDLPAGLNADAPGFNRLNLLLTAPPWRGGTWADQLPSLLEPIGVTAMRAQSARQAERVIRSAEVHIAVVDLSLPLDECMSQAGEEGGTRILDLLSRMPAPPPTVVVQAPRGHRDGARSMNAALRCGAFAVVDRSAADLELMLEVMRRVLAKFYGSRWPGGSGGDGSSNPPRSGRGGRAPFPNGPNVC